jgi:RNA polymerase sigma factor (sigma-70 family)
MQYQTNDEELIYMVRENDEEAWKIIMEKYEPLLKYLAFYYQKTYGVKASIDHEDLLQEMRLTLYKAIRMYKTDENNRFYPYLSASLKNTCNDYYKRRYKRYQKEFLVADISKYELCEEQDPLLSTYYDYYLTELLKDFNTKLNAQDSAIFLLKLSSMAYQDIAKILDINTKKVDNSIFRTKQKLKKYLKKLELENTYIDRILQ